jgi:hypothetical protein
MCLGKGKGDAASACFGVHRLQHPIMYLDNGRSPPVVRHDSGLPRTKHLPMGLIEQPMATALFRPGPVGTCTHYCTAMRTYYQHGRSPIEFARSFLENVESVLMDTSAQSLWQCPYWFYSLLVIWIF